MKGHLCTLNHSFVIVYLSEERTNLCRQHTIRKPCKSYMKWLQVGGAWPQDWNENVILMRL
jgi:hypothetical protein